MATKKKEASPLRSALELVVAYRDAIASKNELAIYKAERALVSQTTKLIMRNENLVRQAEQLKDAAIQAKKVPGLEAENKMLRDRDNQRWQEIWGLEDYIITACRMLRDYSKLLTAMNNEQTARVVFKLSEFGNARQIKRLAREATKVNQPRPLHGGSGRG